MTSRKRGKRLVLPTAADENRDNDDSDDHDGDIPCNSCKGDQRRRRRKRRMLWNPSPTSRSSVYAATLCLGLLGLLLLAARHGVQWIIPTTRHVTATMPPLDFIVAGFPKCGTTTLLYALVGDGGGTATGGGARSAGQDPSSPSAGRDSVRMTDHVLMSRREVCAMKDVRRAPSVVEQRYRRELLQSWGFVEANNVNQSASLAADRRQKGFKCPTLLYSDMAIDRLIHQWYFHPSVGPQPPQSAATTAIHDEPQPHAAPLKWIIGVRHPLDQVQSYYNYLVTEVYDKGYWFYKGIPTLERVLQDHWKDMTPETHRYELHLERLFQQLMKITSEAAVEPRQPLVLLYTLRDLESGNAQLAADLGRFIGLPADGGSGTTPLQWGHENRNRYVGRAGHAETIRLCDDRYQAIRQRLLQDATATVAWMERHVLAVDAPYHPWVLLGGGDATAWRAELHTWTLDICG